MTEKTNLVDDQRLDLGDALTFQSLVYEAMERLVGGLMTGGAAVSNAGLLTAPKIGGTRIDSVVAGFPISGPLTAVPIDSFVYLEEVQPATGSLSRVNCRVVHHDPAKTVQAGLSTINLSGLTPGVDFSLIWATRDEVAADTDTRRKWSVASGDEVSFSAETRLRERVTFAVGAKPAANSVSIARVGAWSGTEPIITGLYALEGGDDNGLTVPPPNGDSLRHLGGFATLGVVTRRLVEQLARILDRTNATSWLTLPARDLAELDAAITSTDADVTATEGRLDVLEAHQTIWAGIAHYTTGGWVFSPTKPAGVASNITEIAAGQVRLDWLGSTVTVDPRVLLVTPVVNHLAPLAADDLPVFLWVTKFDVSGAGNKDVDVYIRDDSAVPTRQSFYVHLIGDLP